MHGKPTALVSNLLSLKNEFGSRAKKELAVENDARVSDLMRHFDVAVYIFSILRIFESIFVKLNRITGKSRAKCDPISSFRNPKSLGYIIHFLADESSSSPESDLQEIGISNELYPFFNWFRGHHFDFPFSISEIREIIASLTDSESSFIERFSDTIYTLIKNAKISIAESHSGKDNDTKILSPAFLEEYFEYNLEYALKKGSGSVYTPKSIAFYIVNRLVEEKIKTNNKIPKNEISNEIMKWRVLDPCCGCGSFIIAYLDAIESQLEAIGIVGSKKADCFKNILRQSLYAFDLNEYALSITKLRITAFYYRMAIESGLNTHDSIADSLIKSLHIQKKNPLIYIRQKQKDIRAFISAAGINESMLPRLFPLYEHEIENKFDIIFGNPPYVRADNQDPDYKSLRKLIKLLNAEEERIGRCFKMKWDLYIAFLSICSIELLKEKGGLGFIISDSFGYSDFSEPLRQLFLSRYCVFEVDLFSSNKVFDGANVRPMILFLENITPKRGSTITINYFEDSDLNSLKSTCIKQLEADYRTVFRGNGSNETITFDSAFEMENIDNICYLSVGIVANAHEIYAKSEFKKKDLIFNSPRGPCKKYLEGKDLEPYKIRRYRYIEWGTERSPSKLRRPTFPELYLGKKILMGTMAAGTLEFEDAIVNHSIVVLRLWKDLKGVNNNSIKLKDRESFEEISEKYSYEYLLAILNSDLIRKYLNGVRVSSIDKHIQPNDYRKVPIPKLQNQSAYIALVQLLIHLKSTQGQTARETKAIRKITEILNAAIHELYYSKRYGTAFNDLLMETFKETDIATVPQANEATISPILTKIETIEIPKFF